MTLLSKTISRRTDVILGGLPQYTYDHQHFASSLSYYSDDFTWCVQRARYLPYLYSFVRIASPAVWLLVVGLGFVNGVVLYFYVQLDSDSSNRKLDVHHTIYLISLPSWIGVSQRFHPKYWPLRLYYMTTLIFGLFFFAIATCHLLDYGTRKIRSYQIHTTTELIEMKFRLAGTAAVWEKVQVQEKVNIYLMK